MRANVRQGEDSKPEALQKQVLRQSHPWLPLRGWRPGRAERRFLRAEPPFAGRPLPACPDHGKDRCQPQPSQHLLLLSLTRHAQAMCLVRTWQALSSYHREGSHVWKTNYKRVHNIQAPHMYKRSLCPANQNPRTLTPTHTHTHTHTHIHTP